MVGEFDLNYYLGSNALVVLCLDCYKPLYEAKKEDNVTHFVAENASIDHSNAFSNPHRVLLLTRQISNVCSFDDFSELWTEGGETKNTPRQN